MWLSLKLLKGYTNHGESITVPDFTGQTLSEVELRVKDKHLKIAVLDSAYHVELEPGEVIDQVPKPDSKVKESRKIYLTINASTPPLVGMPNLYDKSYRNAEEILKSYGLKLGETSYKADLCENCVLQQKMKGNEVKPGTKIEKGSVIDLLLGDGLGGSKVNVPDLVGLSMEEAIVVIQSSNLNLGLVEFDDDVRQPESALVYKQRPSYNSSDRLNMGEIIDIYLTERNLVPVDTTSIN